jgi:hypothetical protein
METGKLDSALHYENDAAFIIKSSGWEKYLSTILYYTGKIHLMKGDTIRGFNIFIKVIVSAIKQNNTDALTRSYHGLSTSYFNSMQKGFKCLLRCEKFGCHEENGKDHADRV